MGEAQRAPKLSWLYIRMYGVLHYNSFTHTHTADQLFQYIANETNTAKTSSSYGLKPVTRKNGVSKPADKSGITENDRNSSKKQQ